MSNTAKFVLLDRDGVVAAHRPSHTKTVKEMLLLPFVPEALSAFEQKGFKIVIYHHDMGVAEGIVDPGALPEINDRMLELIEEFGKGKMVEAVVSTGSPCDETNTESKIRAGLMLRAAQEHGFTISESWVVGDSVVDMEAAWLIGAKTCLVRSGQGHRAARQLASGGQDARLPDLVARDIFTASSTIQY